MSSNVLSSSEVSLTLVPPSPVSSRTPVEVRAGLRNPSSSAREWEITVFLGETDPQCLLHTEKRLLPPGSTACVSFRWNPAGSAGHRTLLLVARCGAAVHTLTRSIEVVERDTPSTGQICGAFLGFCHWSEQEGRLWNPELKLFTDDDWRAMMRAQHELGMDIVVPQEMFRNQEYVGEHRIETEGYRGAAFYPSALYSARMPIGSADPLEAVLDESDALGMSVFVPVGMYAWFDFSEGSLDWHCRVAAELWQRYGHHPSFYGWYVSEEIAGDLGTDDVRRAEIVRFFAAFRAACRALAPDKPIMLASNCHGVPSAESWYPRLLENLDILCPFGFQRMPENDLSAAGAAALLQRLCDEAGSHLWLDMEAFRFEPDMALAPRPIADLLAELHLHRNFEKIICYQFPGIFNAPDARLKPGGPETVRLFNDYLTYYRSAAALQPAEAAGDLS